VPERQKAPENNKETEMQQTTIPVSAPIAIRSILRTQDLTPQFCDLVFQRADELEPYYLDRQARTRSAYRRLRDEMSEFIMVNLFSGESTRTRMSFSIAAKRLGIQVESFTNFKVASSYAKGESLEHTYMMSGVYLPDLIVIRDDDTAGAAELMSRLHPKVPIINAGDGSEQHPTQAMLNLRLIKSRVGKLGHQKVVVVGDTRYGRAAKSDIYMMAKFPSMHIIIVSPQELRIPQQLREYLEEPKVTDIGVTYEETDQLHDALKVADIVSVSRIQKNLFEKDPETGKLTAEAQARYERTSGQFSIGLKEMGLLKDQAFVIHPLPIDSHHPEIAPEVSNPFNPHPKCLVWQQVWSGLAMRGALAEYCLGGEWWNHAQLS